MTILTAEHIEKSYSERPLLHDVSFGVEEGEKIGIIGVNGTGKSTLLKIIAGVEEPDQGFVTKAGGIQVGYLPQNPEFPEGTTVLQQVKAGAALTQQESQEYEYKAILKKLGIDNFDAPINTLSGGQKKRVAMAAALASQSQLLILDEPTNHIDSSMVQWLEDYLARYKGALLMVTHDRYFLDRVTTRLLEIDRGQLYQYEGNYARYLELKSQREEMAQATERKRQSLLKKELAWIQRGARARGTKAQFRVDRFHELSQQQVDLERQTMEMSSVSSRLGKKIIEISGITKTMGGRTLFQDFSYQLLRDDRIGVIGPNGCGKSTLLKVMVGLLQPDSGRVEIGETVKIGYFSQECEEMDLSLRAIDYIRQFGERVKTVEGDLSASQMMERFLFDSTLQYTTIGRLSGGERRRLYLLGILITAPNVLLLDEPTNDLDIQTLSILEDYLEEFQGAVLTVSHDRYFLDKVCDHIFAFEDGKIQRYLGGYTDYQQIHQEALKAREKTMEKEPGTGKKVKTEKLKFTYKEQKEYETIDGEIAALEQQISEVEQALGRQTSDFTRLQELLEQKEKLNQTLSEKMERWVYLQELAEKISAQ